MADRSYRPFVSSNDAANVHDLIASAIASMTRSAPQLDASAPLSSLLYSEPAPDVSASALAGVSTPEVSAFMKLLDNTRAKAEIGRPGTRVTVFAPDNKAMAAMRGDMNTRLATKDMAEKRELFARQHLVVMDSQDQQSAAHHSGSVMFTTANPVKHLSYGLTDPTASSRLAVTLHNAKFEPSASADIVKTITDHTTGTTLHVLSGALID